MIAAVLLSAACLPAGAQSFLRGDADGDGAITSSDVTYVQRVIAGILPDPDGSISKRGAVTGGGLTLADATEIQRYLAGFMNRYHIGEAVPETPTTDNLFPTEDNQLPILKQ